MYSLNNIPLINFGITPGRVDASNIAVSGMLDMPARIGKIFHDWTGSPGVEPYVLASEIKHGGRTITFSGFLQGENRENAAAMLQTFYRELDSFTALVPFTTPWGSHMVHIREKAEAIHLQPGFIKIELQFDEPVVPNASAMPVGDETMRAHFDGVALASLGMFLSGVKNHLNRPKAKDQQFTAYQNQGFQITPVEVSEFELELVAAADNYETLAGNIKSLQKLLSAPGLRTINVDKTHRQVFNTKGFKVASLKVSDSYAVCKIQLPFYMGTAGPPVELAELMDYNDNHIVDNLNTIIEVTV